MTLAVLRLPIAKTGSPIVDCIVHLSFHEKIHHQSIFEEALPHRIQRLANNNLTKLTTVWHSPIRTYLWRNPPSTVPRRIYSFPFTASLAYRRFKISPKTRYMIEILPHTCTSDTTCTGSFNRPMVMGLLIGVGLNTGTHLCCWLIRIPAYYLAPDRELT